MWKSVFEAPGTGGHRAAPRQSVPDESSNLQGDEAVVLAGEGSTARGIYGPIPF